VIDVIEMYWCFPWNPLIRKISDTDNER